MGAWGRITTLSVSLHPLIFSDYSPFPSNPAVKSAGLTVGPGASRAWGQQGQALVLVVGTGVGAASLVCNPYLGPACSGRALLYKAPA